MSINVVAKHKIAVDIPVLQINELISGLITNDDISVAIEKAAGDSGDEKFKTATFDEWLCVLKGRIICKIRGSKDNDIVVGPGETVFIQKNCIWKPWFPETAEFIAVCKPAFAPDRVKILETTEPEVPVNTSIATTCFTAHNTREYDPDLLYHMTTVSLWKEAIDSGNAYYPPTFETDGMYTHATAVPSRLISTANHFYQNTEGDWICLEFTRSALKKCGIIVKDEQPLPVGDKAVNDEWVESNWVCPHVYGGIPLSVVVKTYPIIRNGKTFIGIEGIN